MSIVLNKKVKSVITAYIIILLMYVIGFLIIPFKKVPASWISFAFTIVAFIVSLMVCYLAFGNEKNLVSRIYGFPIFRIGVIYALVQLIAGIVICILGAFVTVPYWIALLVSMVLLGMAALGVIVTDNTRDMIEAVDESTKTDTENVTYFQIDIAGIVDVCMDTEVKNELKKLNELFEYSDPVTNEKTMEIEEKITTMLTKLKGFVVEKKTEDSKALIEEISSVLKERNRICKVSK